MGMGFRVPTSILCRGLRQQGRSLREITAALNGQALRTRRGTDGGMIK